ncbi:hypothetical protein [Sedimenticola sp.]|uniref:hypothetical protein n=1 Tax=Sedimenticola sp. TaxID=1940285 RepID=UPI003D0F0ACF
MSTSLFDSQQAYRSAFGRGLREMLTGYDELGVFILVLANAMIDPEIWDELSVPLRQKFERLARLHGDSRQGGSLDDAQDDRRVFSQLMEMGFDAITPVQWRQAGPWELQFNSLRALRPPRMIERQVAGLSAPFNPDEFHFAKPFLRKEICWRGELQGRDVSLLYNKFPFVRLLGLLVPEAREGRPQLLHQADHDYIWRVIGALQAALPGVGIGYNSFGACASVNHLHGHLFVRDEPLPIAADHWSHNGGDVDYPSDCLRFGSAQESWSYIQDLHGRQVPYNLIAFPDTLYCLPRRPQGSGQLPGWSSGYGWYEMAGGCVPQDEAQYRQLTAEPLTDALQALKS